MLWTVVLVTIGVLGLWLAPRSWTGWAVCAWSEVLWFWYACTIGATALAVMAVIWFVVHARNTVVTWKEQHRGLQQ